MVRVSLLICQMYLVAEGALKHGTTSVLFFYCCVSPPVAATVEAVKYAELYVGMSGLNKVSQH